MNMTHDEMIAVIQAHKENKDIKFQLYSNNRWVDYKSGLTLLNIIKEFEMDQVIRIKPTSTKRPMRIDELPALFWVRYKTEKDWELPWKVNDDFIFIKEGCVSPLGYKNGSWEWSPDRKTVHSFEVDEIKLDPEISRY